MSQEGDVESEVLPNRMAIDVIVVNPRNHAAKSVNVFLNFFISLHLTISPNLTHAAPISLLTSQWTFDPSPSPTCSASSQTPDLQPQTRKAAKATQER